MELNETCIGLQGVLLNIKNVTGDLTGINFIGGNEEKLDYIIAAIAKFLSNKGYLNDLTVVNEFEDQLNEIILFLAINTNFKKSFISNKYSHLLNIIPPLSKCVFSTICFKLKLYKQYGYIIEKLPLECSEECLDHLNLHLKVIKTEESIVITCNILKSVINKLSSLEASEIKSSEDYINNVTIASKVVLQNCTGIFANQIEHMKKYEIYKHMGLTLLILFDLLLYANENSNSLKNMLDNIIYSTISIIKNITINVFCYWAEVKYDDDNMLQSVLAEKAYEVKEKYQNYKFASELNSILSGMARKPKSLAELIYESDVPTMIKKISQKDQNQKKWFVALLSTSCIFQNPEIVKCLDQWSHLCGESDVSRLLDAPLPSNGDAAKQLIMKCTANLKLEELSSCLIGYFYKHGFNWNYDTKQQLVSYFNQCDSNLTNEQLKDILLLILQNASLFFHYFFDNMSKNNHEIFRKVLHLTKHIANIDNIGLNTLVRIIEENPFDSVNIKNYINLFNSLLKTEFYNWDFIVSNILDKFADKYMTDGNLEGLNGYLRILKEFHHLKCELLKEINLYESMLVCGSKYRCKSFLQFNSLEDEITRSCVDYMLIKSETLRIPFKNTDNLILAEHITDEWSMYYKALLLQNRDSISFLDHVLPNFDLSHYTAGKSDENFTQLVKVLSRCVSTEWEILLKEIQYKYNFSIALKALTDIIILFCEIIKNQKHVENHEIVKELELSMKSTLQNFARFLNLDHKLREEQVLAIHSVCRILRYIPDDLKESEGMILLNILPEEVLRSFAQDKEFVAAIILIGSKQICKALAQKVIGGSVQ